MSEELPDPIETGEEIICRLQDAIDLIQSVVDDLRNLQNTAE